MPTIRNQLYTSQSNVIFQAITQWTHICPVSHLKSLISSKAKWIIINNTQINQKEKCIAPHSITGTILDKDDIFLQAIGTEPVIP